jgi:hypothetical protein
MAENKVLDPELFEVDLDPLVFSIQGADDKLGKTLWQNSKQ